MNKYQKVKSKIIKTSIKQLALTHKEGNYRVLRVAWNRFIKDTCNRLGEDSFKYALRMRKLCKEQYEYELRLKNESKGEKGV